MTKFPSTVGPGGAVSGGVGRSGGPCGPRPRAGTGAGGAWAGAPAGGGAVWLNRFALAASAAAAAMKAKYRIGLFGGAGILQRPPGIWNRFHEHAFVR